MTDQPEKRAFARMALEEKWKLVERILERMALLEARVYSLEHRPPAGYIPDPWYTYPGVRPATTGDPLPPWPEVTCGTHDRPLS